MSNQDKNLIVSIGKRIVEAAKALGHYLKVDTSPVPVCRQCNAPIYPDYEFCSDACGLEYWKKLKDQCDKASGDMIVASYVKSLVMLSGPRYLTKLTAPCPVYWDNFTHSLLSNPLAEGPGGELPGI